MKKIIDKNKFGSWAIITGASSGIGEGFARQLAADGLNLVLVARRVSLLEKIGLELKEKFQIQYRTLEADLAEESSILKIIEATSDLDIGLLVSNAGTGKVSRFLAMEEEEHKSFIRLNALSHLSLAHHFGRMFEARKSGGILFTGAMGATDGVPFMASMAGSKAFLLSLGKSLHHEFKNSGVHITVLITSPTQTAIISKLGFDKGKMPMKPLLVEQCVEEALEALHNNRVSVMPGRAYRIMNALVPGSVKRKMTGDIFQKNNNIA
jgi:short-subunit dehydrogenase